MPFETADKRSEQRKEARREAREEGADPIFTRVAGVTFHRSAVRHYEQSPDVPVLELEPDNEYDANAVKVVSPEHGHLGYIPRHLAQEVKSRLERRMTYVICYELTGQSPDYTTGIRLMIQFYKPVTEEECAPSTIDQE